MTDRDSPVTADELHAYVDGMLPADRTGAPSKPGLPAIPTTPRASPNGARRRRRCAPATARCAEEPVPARFDLAKLTRPRASWRAIAAAAILAAAIGGAAGWVGAWRRGDGADHARGHDRGGAQRPPALHRRGAPSDRGARGRAASDAVAVEARRHQPAGARPEGVFAQAAGRPAAARADRAGGAVHV